MTYASDDLTPQLAQQATGAMRHGTGTLLSFNPDTFDNSVEFRGVVLRNLPVLSGTDALSWRPGDVVALDRWDATGRQGAASYAIKGRYIVPGTGASERAVAFLRGELARQITLEVFGAAIHAQGENVVSIVDSLAWGDPSTGPAGPEITNIDIGATGRCLVFISVQFRNLFIDVDGSGEIQMSVEVSGATSRAAGAEGVLSQGRSFGSANFEPSGGVGRAFLVDGLNPGSHTFATKFQVTDDATQASIVFPELIVIPF